MTICDPCKLAGDKIEYLRLADDKHAHRMWIKVVRDHHAQCKGSSWCGCQHKIPERAQNDS